jgi:hypothetical protein
VRIELQLARDARAGDARGQEFLDGGEAFACPGRQPGLGLFGRRLGGVWRRWGNRLLGFGDRFGQVSTVGDDDRFDGVAEVSPQMPPVGDLDRVGGADVGPF